MPVDQVDIGYEDNDTDFARNVNNSGCGMPATIRDYIKRDLLGRIGAAGDLPADLTLAALARHYGVSFTPVRAAIRDLVAEGVLLKQGNGRVRVDPENAATADLAAVGEGPEPTRRSAVVEEALAAEVIGRSLRGEADYVREEAAAQRLGVGRTAVRQALGRLAGRGLVVHVPRCGWRVRPFDEGDLDAYLEVRELLELKAVDLARPRLVEADLRRMLDGNDPGGRPPLLNDDLHGYLVEKAGNAYIRDVFDRHGPYFRSLFNYAAPETRHVAEMARQHRDILAALIARDWQAASRALAEHIRSQRPIVKELMTRIGRSASGLPQSPESLP